MFRDPYAIRVGRRPAHLKGGNPRRPRNCPPCPTTAQLAGLGWFESLTNLVNKGVELRSQIRESRRIGKNMAKASAPPPPVAALPAPAPRPVSKPAARPGLLAGVGVGTLLIAGGALYLLAKRRG